MTGTAEPVFEPLTGYEARAPEEMERRAAAFADEIGRRRTVRDFADKPVPRGVIEAALRAATSAPSGANLQPWHFTVIEDPTVKHRVRAAAEEEERAFYAERAPKEWLAALAPLGTDADKGFLDRATLIAIFAQRYGQLPDGTRVKHYYVPESVGIATGFLIAALHAAGLATLTHTPSPMNFLAALCGRPDNERPYLLLVTGYPAPGCKVPAFGRTRRPMSESTSWM